MTADQPPELQFNAQPLATFIRSRRGGYVQLGNVERHALAELLREVRQTTIGPIAERWQRLEDKLAHDLDDL